MPYSKKYYKEYYQENKAKIAEKRKEKYASDPSYRDKARAASKKQLDAHRHPRPTGFNTSLEQASKKLGLSIWVVRSWRNKNYFPEPLNHAGRRWLTDHQMAVLIELRDTLEKISDGNHRTRQTNLARRDEIVSWVYANWNS